MAYEVIYTGADNETLDNRAIEDTIAYLGEDMFQALLENTFREDVSIDHLNLMYSMAGVSGRPFHAIMRKHRLTDYITWRTSGHNALDPSKLGPDGHVIK